jgi:hypothetical protein
MKLLVKILVLVAAALLLAAAKLEPWVPAPATQQARAFAPPNASWAQMFSVSQR